MVSYELLKIDYYNYYANLYVTQALTAQGKYEVATEIIHKMLALYPTDISYLEALAVVYKILNQNIYKNFMKIFLFWILIMFM